MPLESIVRLGLRGAIAVPRFALEESGKMRPPETAHGDGKTVDDVDAVVEGAEKTGQVPLEQDFYRP